MDYSRGGEKAEIYIEQKKLWSFISGGVKKLCRFERCEEKIEKIERRAKKSSEGSTAGRDMDRELPCSHI